MFLTSSSLSRTICCANFVCEGRPFALNCTDGNLAHLVHQAAGWQTLPPLPPSMERLFSTVGGRSMDDDDCLLSFLRGGGGGREGEGKRRIWPRIQDHQKGGVALAAERVSERERAKKRSCKWCAPDIADQSERV